MEWKVQWSDWNTTHERSISSSKAAEELIAEIQRTAEIPALVEFFNNHGTSFGMGVGRSFTVLTYQASISPPYFVSLGDKNATGTEWFCYGNEESEYLAKSLVAFDLGLQALREFVETGKQPLMVSWERL